MFIVGCRLFKHFAAAGKKCAKKLLQGHLMDSHQFRNINSSRSLDGVPFSEGGQDVFGFVPT